MTGPVVHFNIGVCAYRSASGRALRPPFARSLARLRWRRWRTTTSGSSPLPSSKQDEAATLVRAGAARSQRRTLAIARDANSSRELPQPPNATGWPTARSRPAMTTTSRWSPAATCSASAARTTRSRSCSWLSRGPLTGPWRFDGDVVLLDYQDLDSFDQLASTLARVIACLSAIGTAKRACSSRTRRSTAKASRTRRC